MDSFESVHNWFGLLVFLENSKQIGPVFQIYTYPFWSA